MRTLGKWVIGGLLWVPVFIGCGSKSANFQPGVGDDSGSASGGGDDSGGGSGSSSGSNNNPPFLVLPDASVMTADSMCKGGHYNGTFDGSYSSSLTVLGLPLMVSGNVDMTLYQEGSATQTCTLNGESESCNNVFSLQNGTITGVANGNDAGGGYPYFCNMTGTLDCVKKKLVNGWIECTYCVTQLADGGMGCAPLIAGLGGGIGGMFAGPLTADYDYGTVAFVNGTWNGTEALCPNMVCNNGMMPGPDGGSVSQYLTDAGYGGPGSYGGNGTWTAKHTP